MTGSPEVAWLIARLGEWSRSEPLRDDPLDGIDAERLYHLLFHHRLAPWLAGTSLRRLFPDALQRELLEDLELEGRAVLDRVHGLSRLGTDLPPGLKPMVLKGWAVGTDLYPTLDRRPCWDIDLLVDDPGELHQHLEAVGWIAATEDTPWSGDHHHP